MIQGFLPKLSSFTNLLEYIDIISNGRNLGYSADLDLSRHLIGFLTSV
jgi:hypothetical protein